MSERENGKADRPEGAVVEAWGLGKVYPHPSGPVRVLGGLDISVGAGEVVAIVGKSGSGKSTLLHVLGTLDRPSEGGVRLLGEEVFALEDGPLSLFRNRHIGFIFQFHHLLPEFSALENVLLPALIHGTHADSVRPRAAELLDRVGLGHRLSHKPSELSGGEQQRVALARALIMKPEVLLADEPTGNLDPRTGAEVHEVFLEVSRELQTTVLLATHNPDLATRSDRRLRLADGRLREE